MATLYLHGGMQKTGTTAIQHFLASNRDTLKLQNAVYPDFSDFVHHDWVPAIRNGYWLNRRNLEKPAGEVFKNATARIGALSEEYEKIILSDEMLWGNKFRKPALWPELKEALAPYDITIKVVIYLRRQDDYTYSIWAQNVKSVVPVPYKTYPFQKYLEEDYHSRQPLDYLEILQVIEEGIGRENILLRVYEPEQFEGEPHTITSDFCKTIGLSADAGYKEAAQYKNVSLKDSVLEAKRYLNQLPDFSRSKETAGVSCYDALLAVQEQMQEDGTLQNRTGFTNAQRRAFMESYEAGNAEVARRYLGRENGVLFYRKIPETEEFSQDYTTEELIEVCGRAMLLMQDRIDHLEQTAKAAEKENRGLQKEKAKLERQLEEANKGLIEKILRK